MDLGFPHADDIDSLCHVVERTQEPDTDSDTDTDTDTDSTPTAISPRCKAESVAWVVKPDGTRLYVCRDHALEPFRFPAAGMSREDLPDGYNDLRRVASERGVRLDSPTREELENRLLSPPDPAAFEGAPRVARCSTCGKLSLVEDMTVVEGRCRACDEDVPELDPTDYAVTTPSEA